MQQSVSDARVLWSSMLLVGAVGSAMCIDAVFEKRRHACLPSAERQAEQQAAIDDL